MSATQQQPAQTANPGDAAYQLQRNALHELVRLLTESAERQKAIDERLKAETAAADRELAKSEADVEVRFQKEQEEVRQQYEQRAGEIRARFEKELDEAGGEAFNLRQRLESDAEAVESDVKHKLQQAVWLAESVHEGAHGGAAEEYRRTKEKVTAAQESVDALEAKAHALLARYGHRVPPDHELSLDVPVPSAEATEDPARGLADAEAQRDAAQARLTELGELGIPGLFVGFRPYLMVVLLCLVAAVIAQGVAGGLPTRGQGLAGFKFAWQAIAIGAGGTLALCVIAGAILYFVGRSQVRKGYVPLRRAVAGARVNAEAALHAAAERRDQQRARATKKRDAEVAALRARYQPMIDRAARNRQAALTTAEGESGRRLGRLRAQQDEELAAAEQWQRATMLEVRQRHDQAWAQVRQRHQDKTSTAAQSHAADRAALQRRWEEGPDRIQRGIGNGQPDGDGAGAPAPLDWNSPAWADWSPPRAFAPQVRFGQMQVDLKDVMDNLPGDTTFDLKLPERFAVPAVLAFPSQASLLIQTDAAGRSEAVRAMQMVIARLLTNLPAGRARFTIIDPIALGQNFAGFMHLADHDEALVGPRIWTDADQIDQRLRDLTEHMETVIQKYLRNEYQTIDQYNAQAGELAEPYRFLVVADFPHNFSPEAVRRLNSIASTGARCGVYTIVMRDVREQLPAGSHIDELQSHSVNLVRQGDRFAWNDEVFRRFPLELDSPPDEATLTRVLDVVGRGAKEAKRVEVPFEQIAPAADDGQFWSGDTSDELRVPIGRLGATRQQTLRLGKGVAQHALIAGKTGSGKSTLLHVLVTNLAMWYPPDEVQFYLVDFKKGVEFKAYATHGLPHARAIAVESDREFGLSVLQRVDAELSRRGALFREAGVQDLPGYRRATKQTMPRVLLIIDEFQEFFTEDDRLAQDAGLLLDRLVRQGRAFGIHVLLGSQTIGGSSGLARSTLGQMAVRIALQTSEADAHLILSDNNSAARLLTRPGEAIYNDAGGLVEANSPFQIAWLSDEQRERYLQVIRQRFAGRERGGAPAEPPIVFEGNVPADLRENRKLREALAGAPPAAGARVPAAPRAWLGEPVAIKEPTGVPFRRQAGANLLVVGQAEESALALLAASMLSLAAQHPPDRVRFHVLDGTPADSVLHGRLAQVADALPPDVVRMVEFRGVDEAINELAIEMQRRLDEGVKVDAPNHFLVVYGLQRYRVLRKSEDSFGFSMSSGDEEKKPQPDKQFADLLREGPGVGIHVLAWIDTAANIERTLDRAAMREFDHRVLFQMSANDSSTLIDSPAANKLGFYRALAYSEEQGVTEKFRPYALPDAQWLNDVKSRLAPAV